MPTEASGQSAAQDRNRSQSGASAEAVWARRYRSGRKRNTKSTETFREALGVGGVPFGQYRVSVRPFANAYPIARRADVDFAMLEQRLQRFGEPHEKWISDLLRRSADNAGLIYSAAMRIQNRPGA